MGEGAQIDSGPEMEREERRAAVGYGMLRYMLEPLRGIADEGFHPPVPDLSPESHSGVTLLPESSLKPHHLPLSTGREVASIRSWGLW